MHRCALALIAAALAIAGCGGQDDSTKLNGETKFKLDGGKAVSLPAYGDGLKGDPHPLRPVKGKLMLLYFGYISCPDVCPTSMSDLAVAVRSLPVEQQKQLEVGLVTADPKRDSGAELVDYLEHFFRKQPVFGFRTTDKAELAKAEKAFGAASQIDPHKPGEAYTVTHTAYIYAVNRDGRILVMWPFGTPPTEMSSDLKVLLGEQHSTSNN